MFNVSGDTGIHCIGVNVMESGSAAKQMGNTITTPSNDVIVTHCLLSDRNSLGPSVMMYIDWKGLAWQKCGSRTICRGIPPCKALHWSPTIPRHYSIQPIKTWVGKCTNNIMLVWASWHVNCGLSPDKTMYVKLSPGDKPHNRVIIPQDPGKLLLLGKQWWRNNIQEEMLVQDLEANLTLSSQSDQQVTRRSGQEFNLVGTL